MKTLLKSLLVGIVYAITLALGGMIVTIFGFSLPEVKNPLASLAWSFVGGVIAGLSLAPVASSMPASRTRHLIIWGTLIFFNIASVAIEGYFIAPALIGDSLPALLLQQLVAAFAAGFTVSAACLWLIRTGGRRKGSSDSSEKESVWMSILNGVKYLWNDKALRLTFLVILAMNFLLVALSWWESLCWQTSACPRGSCIRSAHVRFCRRQPDRLSDRRFPASAKWNSHAADSDHLIGCLRTGHQITWFYLVNLGRLQPIAPARTGKWLYRDHPFHLDANTYAERNARADDEHPAVLWDRAGTHLASDFRCG